MRFPSLYFILLLLPVLFSSCFNRSNNVIAAFVTVDSALVNSNAFIDDRNKRLYAQLDNQPKNDREKIQIATWQPKIQSIKDYSSMIANSIISLKAELIHESGRTTVNGQSRFADDNMDAGERLFRINKKGSELYTLLKEYRERISGIDPEINKAFKDNLVILSGSFDTGESDRQAFVEKLLSKNPSIAGLALLDQFLNNVRLAENKVLEFCFEQVASQGAQP